MKGTLAVLRSDLENIVHSRGFLLITAIIGIVTVWAAVVAPISLNGLLAAGVAWEEAKPTLEFYEGMTVNFAPLIVLLAFMVTWGTEPLAKEKTSGTIESLLATPLTAKAVWMGKSLAIFLPAYIIGAIATLIIILAMNLTAILPATGRFFFPLPQAFTGFLFLPLLMFALISLGVMLSLITNPVIGKIVVILGGMILLQGIGLIGARVTGLLASWDYALYNLAGAALLGIIAFCLSRSLNKEKIVLSSKGKWA